MDQVWTNRAASAEAAVTKRHLKRLWQLPGTQLGAVGWPPTRKDLTFGTWHYWWQAHLLDNLIDAQLRDPQPERQTRIKRQIRSHRLRNNMSWVNSYYDDMAWLALALAACSNSEDLAVRRWPARWRIVIAGGLAACVVIALALFAERSADVPPGHVRIEFVQETSPRATETRPCDILPPLPQPLVMLMSLAAARGENLLLNGDAEQGKGDQPSIWFAAHVPAAA